MSMGNNGMIDVSYSANPIASIFLRICFNRSCFVCKNFSINSDPLILKSCTAHNKMGSFIKGKETKENEYAICPNVMDMLQSTLNTQHSTSNRMAETLLRYAIHFGFWHSVNSNIIIWNVMNPYKRSVSW